MPWCPKCKSEYREGFTVCADCGSPLVEEKPDDRPEDPPQWEEEVSELSDLYGDTAAAGAAQEEADLQVDEQLSMAAAARRTFGGNSYYQDSSQKADNNRSSAWILLTVGVLGLVLVVLGAAEVIPLHLGNPYLFYGVMGAIFVLFLVTGAISMKNARIFAGKAESENSLKSTMLDWCRENLRADEIDSQVDAEGAAEEVLYFSRTAYIREKLNHQFVNLDQDFLDQFVDDQVYGMVFEAKE